MKRALETLGVSPCYHMYDVLPDKERFAHWLAVSTKRAEPFRDETFAGYCATVDWPRAHYRRELAAHYPSAKNPLTVRDSESWFASMNKTIVPMMRGPVIHPYMAQALRQLIFRGEVDATRETGGSPAREPSLAQRHLDSKRNSLDGRQRLPMPRRPSLMCWFPYCGHVKP